MNNSTSETDPTTPQDDWQTLRTTLILYLPAFCFVAVFFCFVRRRYPLVYNVRNSVDRLKCRLAVETYGFINWTWILLQIPQDELVEQCGLDACCLCRVLRVGLKLALLGCFCALFLVPSYATAVSGSADPDQEDGDGDNPWITTTTAHLPQGSRVFTATVLAVYLLMGYTLYLVTTEFRWFTAIRAQTFLSKVCPRSYSVYVTGVPLQLRSDQALRDFFRRVLSNDAVVMASVPLHIPNLRHKINQRRNLQNNLEHYRALQHDHGVPNPTLAPALGLGECVPAIPYYQQQLIELNAQIKQVYARIRTKQAATARASKTAVKASYALARQCQSSNESRHLEVALSQRNRVRAGNHNPDDHDEASNKSESSSDRARNQPVAPSSLSATPLPQQNANNGDAAVLSSTATVSHCRSIWGGEQKFPYSSDRGSDDNEQEDSMAFEPSSSIEEKNWWRQGDSSGGTSPKTTATTTSGTTKIENVTTVATTLPGTPTLPSPSPPKPSEPRPSSILRLTSSQCREEEIVSPRITTSSSETTTTAPSPALSGNRKVETSVSFHNSEHGGMRERRLTVESVPEARSLWDKIGNVEDQDNGVERQPIRDDTVMRSSGGPRQGGLWSQGQSARMQASRSPRRASNDSSVSGMEDGSLGDFYADRSRSMQFMPSIPYQASKEKLEEIFTKNIAAIAARSNDDEGMPLSAGFVTFSKLSAVNAALQVVHSSTPSQILAEVAPDPDHIIWHNVGLSNNSLQAGRLLSATITIVLIIFWTVPVTAIVSLTEVYSLQEFFPFLEDWLEAAPWLEGVLNQLAPLTLSLLNSVILPVILMGVSQLDGVIDISFLQSSLVVKLTAFHIVQTFLIASLASSVSEALSKVQTVGDTFRYLAKTLPPQAVFFIQLVLISTVIGIGAELLRTTALVQAGFRKFLGPRVTQEERDKPCMGLRPLSNPRFFLFAQILAKINLFFMILLTFAALAPFICFVMAFAFLVLEIAARHQLIYIYPILDSGGKLWLHSIKILLICVVIAEGIVMSYMGIVKATAQFYMMIPLLVVTVLFEMYLFQRHFIVASHLSSEDCVAFDVRNDLNNSTAQELFGTPYLQPAIREAQNDELRTIDEDEGQLASSHSIK